MAHITLIRPPQVMPYDVLTISQGVPSIGIAYLMGALRKAGHQVCVIDALAEDLHRFRRLKGTRLQINGLNSQEIVSRIPVNTDIVAVSAMFSNEWLYTKQVIRDIHQKFQNISIIAGGEHVTADPEFSLRSASGLTACVRGEGEETIVELVNSLMEKGDLSKIAGISFLDKKDKYCENSPRVRIKAIDEIIWPAWDLYPIEKYLDAGFGFNVVRGRPMPMTASRGCPYQCTFCSNPLMWTTRWLARDPREVIDEIKFYIDKYNIDHVEFYDLTAIVKKEWILEFTKLLDEEKISIKWSLPSGTRTEAIDKEVIKMLKKTGCDKLTYAPESGSKATLKRIKKKVNIDRMLNSMRWCVQEGINIKSNIIFGFPGQNKKEVLETLGFMFRAAVIGMNDVSVFSFVPYPGSELFFQIVDSGKIKKGSKDYEMFLSGNVLGDITGIKSWSEYISNNELRFILIFATLWFYSWQFIFRPWRLLGTISRIAKSNPETTLDILIDGVIRNFLKSRKIDKKSMEYTDYVWDS